jgi:hypothetical protein
MSTANTEPGLFTAAQIARALGVSRQAVANGLERVSPEGPVDVDGIAADAWPFGALPLEWKLEITRRGVKRHFENGEKFLASLPLIPWTAPLSWDRVPAKEQAKAVKLQKALARALALRGDPGAAPGQPEQTGLEDFRAQFGYAVSGRHWRRLLARAVQRDGGAENWQYLEIYLDDRAFAAPRPKRDVLRSEYEHRELDELIGSLENRQDPSAEDRQYLWDAVCRHFEGQCGGPAGAADANRKRHQFKASLVFYLFNAFPVGTLSATLRSLKRRFEEKLVQWQNGGRTPAALQDRRPLASGRFRNRGFSEDKKKIRNRAILLDGNEPLARRMLSEAGELSKEFCEAHPYDSRQAKSALPASVREAVTPEVDVCLALRRGPWQARMRGPYIPRDWSDVKPGDWFSGDDVTWNHYFKEQLPDHRWIVLRGECLLMTDLRTGYPLDFLLIPGHYNGEHVRSLVLKVHDRVGLPRYGFYFEKGVWASRLVTGDNRRGTPVHWREAENGLCNSDLKLQMRHATTPRAKPIEGLLRILQERMRCIPGFVGFNEREYDAERIQSLIARAQRGDPQALAQFPTGPEWAASIRTELEKFAHDPQNGKMLQGRAPAEAWSEELLARPLRKLPDASRYVLSTHRKTVTVRQEGIVLIIRGRRYLYYNEHTGPLIGREVLAFYNFEMPELLTVCDMNRQNYFSVKRVELPAMTATGEELEEANRARKGHMAHAKAIFGEVQHEVVSTITRDNEHSEESINLGRFHNAETARAKVQQTERGRKLRKLETKAARAGVDLTGPVRDPDDALEAIDRRAQFLKAMHEEEEGSEANTDMRSYVEYLIKRYNQWRIVAVKSGKDKRPFHPSTIQQVVQKEFGVRTEFVPQARLGELVAFLQNAIDNTIQGRIRRAHGVRSYHSHEEHLEKLRGTKP